MTKRRNLLPWGSTHKGKELNVALLCRLHRTPNNELMESVLQIPRKRINSPARKLFSYLLISKEKIVTEKKLDQQVDKKGTRPEQHKVQPKVSTINQKDTLDETALDKVSGGRRVQ